MKTFSEILIEDNSEMLFEMATFGKPRWDKTDYRISVHGPASKDRETPHIHIYLLKDDNHTNFNFEVSLVDILCNDEINLIYQLDRKNNIMRTHRRECSWDGYSNLYKNFKKFLTTNQNLGSYRNCENGLKAAIEAYNNESNSNGNALKDYLDKKGLMVLPKYISYLQD